ncbi:3-hydroxyacyl-ACP dehydratase [Hydrogenophaga sp. 5NK40-0174]|uniref:3-hydroxyacyl-ACP dehydratase FabZ family protein n=1 Tax=Hydrogenophaga sp. 5NK40-0174 TaxID=3127649 RepID=UPI00310740A0
MDDAAQTEITWQVPPAHPVFDGHFPGRPIVPGVWILDQVVDAVRQWQGWTQEPMKLDSAKFFQPVGPGATLTFTLQKKASGSVAFKARQGGAVVASGQLAQGSSDQP